MFPFDIVRSMLRNSMPDDNRLNRAYARVLGAIRTLPAPTLIYSATLGAIALAQGSLTPDQVALLATPAGALGVNLFSDLLSRAADGLDDDAIRRDAEAAVSQSQIADALTRDQFRQDMARLAGGTNLRALKHSIEAAGRETVEQLVAEFEARHLLLMAEVLALRSTLAEAGAIPTPVGGAPAPVALPELDADARVARRGGEVKVFISYARANALLVNQIARKLSRDHYYEVWLDYDSIPAGARWMDELARGILNADAVLFMATPESIASEYCRAEVEYALRHGVRVIPLRLSGALAMGELARVGLADYNAIDMAANPDAAWAKLLNPATGLPEVLARGRRAADPAFQRLHADYLRSLFTRLDTVRLAHLLDETPKAEVSLFEVYVPLKLGFDFGVEIADDRIVDWWLRDLDTPSAAFELGESGEGGEKRARAKTLKGFAPQGAPLKAWEARMEAAWARRLAEHAAEQAKKEPEKRARIRQGVWNWGRLESEVAPALMPHLVITGNPGSGKSTLLKHLALCLAGDMLADPRANLDALEFWPLPAYTPIFVELRALVRTAFPDPKEAVTLEKWFGYLDAAQLREYGLSDYLPYLREQMRDGDAIIFLDGLDEVPDADQPGRRDQIRALAHLLRRQYADCRIVITSRPYAYKDWTLDGFGQVDLTTLDADRLEELALRLFRVVLGAEGAEQEAPQFKEQVKKVREELRGSPLLFTLMAAIWLNNHTQPAAKRLPVSEGALYRACVDTLIRRWERRDADGQTLTALIGLDAGQLRTLLETLAYRVHSETRVAEGVTDDDAAFSGGRIFDIADELGLGHVNVRALREALAQRAGLTYEEAPNRYRFAHRSFQEHLAACTLAARERFPAEAAKRLRDQPSLWRKVFDLLIDQAVADGRDLWTLVAALMPGKGAPPAADDSAGWAGVLYAARLVMDHLPADHDLAEVWRPRLGGIIPAIFDDARILTPGERAELARALGALGDTRRGVALTPDPSPRGRGEQIPDVAWCDVPDDECVIGGDPEAYNPLPETRVKLGYGFKIARYLVTYAQFQVFLNDPEGFANPVWWRELHEEGRGRAIAEQSFKYPNHPRDSVSWYQAMAYSNWLNARLKGVNVGTWVIGESAVVRLPTEYEWEIAARGPEGYKFPWGNEYVPGYANIDETYGDVGPHYLQMTSAVGLYPQGASPCGALDMAGNVWEWCLNPFDAPESREINSNSRRALRGGSWLDYLLYARAASRLRDYPDDWSNRRGFRLACVPINQL
jgi:formylglycine-generating enzyme required for sulfatase activity